MSKLEELILKYCPDGVERVLVGSLIDLYTGVQLNKSEMHEIGSFPVINGGVNPSGYIEQFNEEADTITVSQGGASAGYVNYITSNFWAGAHCFVVKPSERKVNKRYLYNFLKNEEYALQHTQQGAGIPSVNRDTINSLLIPLPPLPIQEEIVRILDAMTDLQENLEKELEERRRQYASYRDKLLSFNDLNTPSSWKVEWKQLGDKTLFDFHYGKGNNIPNDGGVYNVYGCNGIVSKTSQYNCESAPLIGHIGSAGCVIWCEGKAYVTYNATIANVIEKQRVNSRYLYYFLLTANLPQYVKGSQPFLSVSDIEQISIPLPPLPVQEEIVRILDSMTALQANLEAELVERRKQYEYYRNKILSFE